jgi:hypothetical protein
VTALLCAAVTFAVMFVLAWMYDASIRNREALGQAEI